MEENNCVESEDMAINLGSEMLGMFTRGKDPAEQPESEGVPIVFVERHKHDPKTKASQLI